MPDRADYLARTLLTRRRSLEAVLADDGAVSLREAQTRRLDMVVKVLAVEAGVIDSTLVNRVWSALPDFSPDREDSERARGEFAASLREILGFD